YPWPWRGQVSPEHTALILVSPGAAPPRQVDPQPPALGPIRERVKDLAGRVGLSVEVQAGLGAGPGEAALPGAVRLTSHGWSGFYGSGLEPLLARHHIHDLLLAGAYLEIGVHSTMRAANDRGLECLLLSDACLSADPALEAAALSSIEMSGGIFGAVGTTSAALAAYSS
ncbi:MAG: cysteine hydrolase family protein, partial [Arachnia sp.]